MARALVFDQPNPTQERYVATRGHFTYTVEKSESFGWVAHRHQPERGPLSLTDWRQPDSKAAAIAYCQNNADRLGA